MDLKSLRHAIALAETGNFVRAAAAVHLTQSALSRSIQALERGLGVQLFDRTGSGIKPTAAGKVFLERAQYILQDAQALQREMQLLKEGIGGSIGIGAGPAPAITLLPALLKHCIEQLPELRVNVEINGWPILCEQIKRETIEFFLIDSRNVGFDKGLQITPLLSTEGGAAFCRPGHPLARKRNLTLPQLGAFAIVTTAVTPQADVLYRELFQLRPPEPLPIKLTSDNLFLLLDVVAATDAILITPRSTMRAALAAGTAIELPVKELRSLTRSAGEIVAVTLAQRSLSPAAQYLIAYIQANLAGG